MVGRCILCTSTGFQINALVNSISKHMSHMVITHCLQVRRVRFIIIRTSNSEVCMCNLYLGCQGQSFSDQICTFALFLERTFGRPEWVSCQDNKCNFREDHLTLLHLEIASSGEFCQKFWDKRKSTMRLFVIVNIFESWLQCFHSWTILLKHVYIVPRKYY